MKLRILFTIFLILFVAIPTVFIGLVSTAGANKAITEQVTRQLNSLSDAKQAEVEVFIEGQFQRLLAFSSRTAFRNQLRDYTEGTLTSTEGIERIIADAAAPFDDIVQIGVFEVDGTFIAGTRGDRFETETGIEQNLIALGALGGAIDFERTKREVFVAGPIVLDGVTLGVMVVESKSDVLVNLVTDNSGLGTTGEVLLAKRNEFGDALFLHPRRFEGEVSGSLPVVEKERTEVPITQALLKNETILFGAVDYRGEAVLAATRYIHITDWGLVVKIDRQELFGSLNEFQQTLTALLLIVVTFTVIFAYLVALSVTRPIERLTTYARAVGDGNLKKLNLHTIGSDIQEFVVLAAVLNNTVQSLRASQEDLEKRVRERTHELERAQKTLAEKLDETERLNKVMVNRELKMIELKKKLEKYERK